MDENNLLLKRIFRGNSYTIGHLYLNGTYICDTLEPVDRDLNRNGRFDDGERKVWGETAVPNGTYGIEFRYSPSHSAKHGGVKMPYLTNLTTHTNVMFHVGNTADDTQGCILVGQNKEKGRVINSKATFDRFYRLIKDLHGLTLTIE